MAEAKTDSKLRSETMLLLIEGHSIVVASHTHAQAGNTILLLHEALESVSYWRDFPEQLAQETGWMCCSIHAPARAIQTDLCPRATRLLFQRGAHGEPLPVGRKSIRLRRDGLARPFS